MSKIYKYDDYDHYIETQKKTTDLKYGKLVYIQANVANAIFQEFKDKNVKNILCHGTRSGNEQQMFKDLFDCYVWGSELSKLAKDTPMTTIWDFNKPNPDWVGKFDMVYSNSFDHSITPLETISVWKEQLAHGGRLMIEWTDHQNGVPEATDPFAATEEEIVALATENGLELEKKLLEKRAKHAGSVLVFKVRDNE